MEASSKPLDVDAELLEDRIIGWRNRVRRARQQVISQLESRPIFPDESWQSTGSTPEFAESVAKAFAGRVSWLPNHYFLPDDSLMLLLRGEEMGLLDVGYGITMALNVSLGKNLIDAKTFGDLVTITRNSPVREPLPEVSQAVRKADRLRASFLAVGSAFAICVGFWLPEATGHMGWISIMYAGILGFYIYGNKALHG
jgi:hypothetical protein